MTMLSDNNNNHKDNDNNDHTAISLIYAVLFAENSAA